MAKETTITQRDLDSLAGGGLVRSATAVAKDDEWALVFHIGNTDRTLTTINEGKVKTWAILDSLRDYLEKYGIKTFAVDGKNYRKTSNKKRQRPDAAKTLRRAHAAAAYDDYVKGEVNKSLALIESGEATLIPHEQVKENWRIRRGDILANHLRKGKG